MRHCQPSFPPVFDQYDVDNVKDDPQGLMARLWLPPTAYHKKSKNRTKSIKPLT